MLRQPTCSVRMPPSVGPTARPIAAITGPDADRARLRVRIGERGPDEGQRRDVHDRRTDALEPAHDTQEVDARRQPAADRSDAEDDDADDVRAAAAVVVAERAARHHEHRHREAVRGDDPLEPGLARIELALDVGDRDVHDHRVDEDHEQPKAGGDEHPGALSTRRRVLHDGGDYDGPGGRRGRRMAEPAPWVGPAVARSSMEHLIDAPCSFMIWILL